MTGKTFEDILARLRTDNGSGYPVLYPPMPVWKPIPDGEVTEAWRASPAAEPLDLLARLPFCRTICSFCYLPVRAVPRAGAGSYLDALEREIEVYGRSVAHRSCQSFYLGGGTPNVLPLKDLERVFGAVKRAFRFKPGAQWAIDANPEFLTPEQAKALKGWGVDWMTIGVQSLDDAVIGRTARTQTSSKVRQAYDHARNAGLGVNIDLMCGLPGQTEKSFLRDAREVLSWRPEQVHVYLFKPLAITPFTRAGGRMEKRDVRRWKGIQRRAMDVFLEGGYGRLDEESASLGERRVNRQLQRLFDKPFSLMGLGMGSISFVYAAVRYVNTMDQRVYESRLAAGGLPIDRGVLITAREEMINYLLLQFAETDRISRRSFEKIFGEGLASRFGPVLARLVAEGVLRKRGDGYEAVSDKAFLEVPRALYEPRVSGALAAEFGLAGAAA